MEKITEEGAMQESTPPTKTINDVPPEVLAMILKKLDCVENSLLPYRLVHPEWKNLINDILEKQALKGNFDSCSKVFIYKEGGLFKSPNAMIHVPLEIFRHPDNPFPGRSLLVGWPLSTFRNYGGTHIVQSVDIFTTTFGSHINALKLGRLVLEFSTLISILTPLSNLKILKLYETSVKNNIKNSQDDLKSLPALPHLATLDLEYSDDKIGERNSEEQCITKIVDAYAAQLISLRLKLKQCDGSTPIQRRQSLIYNTSFHNLQQLKVFCPTQQFLCLKFVSPLKRLSIVGFSDKMAPTKEEITLDVLMRFVDAFSETLETLELDVRWTDLLDDLEGRGKQKVIQTCGIRQTAAVIFPKLTKLAVHYPLNWVEEAVLKNTFLYKFPTLRHLHLLQFSEVFEEQEDEEVEHNMINMKMMIMEFINRENYWKLCMVLNRVSVWTSGEFGSFPSSSSSSSWGTLVHSCDEGDIAKYSQPDSQV